MKGPRPARMPVYGAGSKYLGRVEKKSEWRRFHAPQPPAIPIAPLQCHALQRERLSRGRARAPPGEARSGAGWSRRFDGHSC